MRESVANKGADFHAGFHLYSQNTYYSSSHTKLRRIVNK